MTRIITYGTFDLFHFGHLELLRRAKGLGDYLMVAVSTDEFTKKEKGKDCVRPYVERAAIVAANKYVDNVIPEVCWKQKPDDVKKHDIDIFVIGDDWRGKFDEQLDHLCKVVYLPRTNSVSSSDIRKAIARKGLDEKELHA